MVKVVSKSGMKKNHRMMSSTNATTRSTEWIIISVWSSAIKLNSLWICRSFIARKTIEIWKKN